MKNIAIISIIIILLSSCERKAEWEYAENVPNVLVVESILTNELKAHNISLSFLSDSLNQEPSMMSGATVNVYENQDLISFSETSDGIYESPIRQFALVNKVYSLSVEYGGKTYYAQTYALPVSAINPLEYSASQNEEGWYKINQVASSYNFGTAAMHEIYLDWSHLNLEDDKGRTSVKLVYYSLPTIDIHQLFAPDKENIAFPLGTKVEHKKYALTPKHASYIRSLLTETEWKGGYFDPPAANLPTNLSEGAIGFFATCSVVSSSFPFD